MSDCCDGCPDGDCEGVEDMAVARTREWLAKKKYGPTPVTAEVAAAIEDMAADMEQGLA